MNFNPESRVRKSLYLLTVFVNAVMGVLATSGEQLPVIVLAVVAGFNAVVAIMANANVTPDVE